MQRSTLSLFVLLALPFLPGSAQDIGKKRSGEDGWDRTRTIMECAPVLVDRQDLVEDQFDHRYVTDNPRDIEVGYFSVEPVTYSEQGRRFCEALLPAAGVSGTYFRGSYVTSYTLPGAGTYTVSILSTALIFNNDIRMIDAQDAIGDIEASHRLEIEVDTARNPPSPENAAFRANLAYRWELEIGHQGNWHGEITPGEFDLLDTEVPAGYSDLSLERKIRGPGAVTIRESVIFRVNAISAYKYAPIFQAACFFSLEPLSISTWLLPCED
jgi:hypothetical protein